MTRLQRLSFVALSSLLLSAACTSNDGGAGTSSDLDSGAALSDAEAGFDVPTNPDVALDVSNDSSLEDFGVDGACGATTVHASARDVALLLVVDASGSMNQTPKGFSTNKWSAMKTALSTSLGKVKEKLSLGLEIFPRDPLTPIADPCSGNCCAMPSGEAAIEVPVGPGVSSLDPIVSTLGSFSPGGATPTATALHRALDYFTTGAGKSVSGDKYVLLATDGGPNCNVSLTCDAAHCTRNLDGNCSAGTNCCDPSTGSKIDCLDDAAVVDALKALAAAGIKTFVVGIPGSEAYAPYLDSFAEAGGMTSPTPPPKYFAVGASGDVAALTGVFDAITGALITTCRLQLATKPEDPTKLNVYVDGTLVPQSGADGWTLDTSTDPPTVVLLGATCDQMKTKGAKVVEIKYGCPTIK